MPHSSLRPRSTDPAAANALRVIAVVLILCCLALAAMLAVAVTATPAPPVPVAVAVEASPHLVPATATTVTAPAPAVEIPTTTAPPPVVAASDPPATVAPAAEPAPTEPEPPAVPVVRLSRCDSALAALASAGLTVPAGFDVYCPGNGVDTDGSVHAGLMSYAPDCRPGDHRAGFGCYVDANLARVGPSDHRLRHVLAHEICHAVDMITVGVTTEAGADLCAAGWGFPG